SLSMLMFQIGMILGPTLAGFVLASRGPGLVYALNAASFVAVILGLALMKVRGRAAEHSHDKSTISLQALAEGLRFVWRTPIIVQTVRLFLVAIFCACANHLLPFFAKYFFLVGAGGLGFLVAAPAVGAVVAGLVMARVGALKRQGKVVIISVAIFGAATI